MDTMFRSRHGFLIALVLSLTMHASLMPSWWGKPKPPASEEPLQLRLMVEPEVKPPPPKTTEDQSSQTCRVAGLA